MRLLACVLFLVGCNVGPKYVPPKAAVPVSFKEAPGAWRQARPQDAALKGRWWSIFEDSELEALESALEAGNQTIVAAFHNFMAARAQVDQARAGYFPTVTVGASAARTERAGGTGAPVAPTAPSVSGTGAVPTLRTGPFFSVPASASWQPDLWGRVGNAVRAARYAAQVSAADLVNARLSEQAALATFFFELRGQDALALLYERTIRANKESLDFVRAQFETGVGTEQAVAQASVTLANTQAAAIGLAASRATYEHAIATLIGKPASSFSLPQKALMALPPTIPPGVPSDLLERRPDIAAAERRLAQANALIGVAEAAYYPSLTLTASGTLAASALEALVSAPTFIWSVGASASGTIIDGGLRRATVAQYAALYRANLATYRQTVLTAFQQVEDQLAILRVLAQQLEEQQRAVEAARRYLELALSRYETGVGPYLEVITARSLLLNAEQAVITAHVNSMTAAVALVEALGGGWKVSMLPSGR